MQNKPEEIIAKLAEKRFPIILNDIYKKFREGYKAALRDVLPLIDGWVKLDADNIEEVESLIGKNLVFCNQSNVFYRGSIGWSYDHEDYAVRSNGVYWGLNNFTHYREEFTPPGDYSSLQKLLE